MADIQQWRRKIQPTRTRTPAVEHEDGESYFAPGTPRKSLKPKFSSYFTQNANNAGLGKKEDLSPDADWPAAWPTDDPYPSPDADVLIDSVMCRILGSPYEGLNPRFNGVLLQIFEGFRALSDEKQRLLSKSELDADRISEMEKVMQQSARQWDTEKQEYKAEIKRLEVLLSKGKRGLAEVTLARQDSLLSRRNGRTTRARKHDSLETIFQFMEKNQRVEEKVWGVQRATMRRKSPSAEMRRLSKTFMSQSTSYPDLPPGTLTDGPGTLASTLAEPSYLDNPSFGDRARAVSDPKTSLSEETGSAFSCAGDLLPEEATDINLIEAAGTDNDFVAIKRIAKVLAKRRHVDADVIMPKLLEMFAARSFDQRTSPPRNQSGTVHVTNNTTARKNTKLMAKASGFFNKLKPQLSIDTSGGEGRRFSFEAGDDSSVSAPAPCHTPRAFSSSALNLGISEKVLRKSISTPVLANYTTESDSNNVERPLSPVQQSPTSSTPVSESRRLSKIPTPMYHSTLARPRQERESSESSLLTAIRFCEDADGRSGSCSSPGYSSRPASGVEVTAGSQSASSTNPLLEHTKTLRGTPFAAAAASKAIENAQTSEHSSSPIHERRLSAQRFDLSERRKENAQPMRSPDRTADHEDLRYREL